MRTQEVKEFQAQLQSLGVALPRLRLLQLRRLEPQSRPLVRAVYSGVMEVQGLKHLLARLRSLVEAQP